MKYLLLSVLLFPLFANSQSIDNDQDSRNFMLGIVPQYAIINGARVDLDFKIKNSKNWLVFAPQIYVHDQGSLMWDYSRMFGFGLEVQHKIYLSGENRKRNLYVAYGPVFNYFSIDDDALAAFNFIENNATYIGLADKVLTTNLYKIGANLIIGIQYTVSERFYIDPYIGTGFRLSFDDRTSGIHKQYTEWWGDMGYSGTLIVGGIRFGVIF